MTYFREVGQKCSNIFVCFLVQMKTSKSHSEINWPLAESMEEVLSRSRTRIGFLCLTFFFFFEFWSPTTIRQLPCSWWLLHLLERFFFWFTSFFSHFLFSILNCWVQLKNKINRTFSMFFKVKIYFYLDFIYSSTTANKFSCLLKPKKPHFTATKYSFLWQ